LAGKSGILLFQVPYAIWHDATGHLSLWNGSDLVNGNNDDDSDKATGVLFWPIQ
jgi:type VI secretion system (T6SS) effector Tae4 (amidase)